MLVKKPGQPVPESNFISEVKTGSPHPAQTKIPGRFSWSSGLVPARSVLSSRKTLYASGGRRLRHSSLESFNGSFAAGTAVPAGTKLFQFFCRVSMSFIFAGGAACPSVTTGLASRAFSSVRRSIHISFRRRTAPWSQGRFVPDILQREPEADGDVGGDGHRLLLVQRSGRRVVVARRRRVAVVARSGINHRRRRVDQGWRRIVVTVRAV